MPFHYHSSEKELAQSMVWNFAFAFIELFLGTVANSTALISDALHDLADSLTLGVSWYAQKQAARRPTKKHSFGFLRYTVLVALFNAILLLFVSGVIFWKAYGRLMHPQPVNGKIIFIVAAIGILINTVVVKKLVGHADDINRRAVMWHILEDLLGWIAVMLGGVILIFTNWTWVDPLISFLIGIIVVYGALSILKQSIDILSDAVPDDVDIDEVKKDILAFERVERVHDTHVWMLGAGVRTISAHIQMPNMSVREARYTVEQVEKMLQEKYNIQHATIEVETEKAACKPGEKCD